MMKRKLLAALATSMSAVIAAPVFAHAGDHAHTSFLGNVLHFITNPDHLLPMAAAVVVIAIYVKRPAFVMRALRTLTRNNSK
jgi:hydrogenase/urease accessory protein HupE